jgi:hypothetical protein
MHRPKMRENSKDNSEEIVIIDAFADEWREDSQNAATAS